MSAGAWGEQVKQALTALHFASIAAAGLLAFAWPFVVSRDRDSAAFHGLAVGVLLCFLATLVCLCAMRLRGQRPGPRG